MERYIRYPLRLSIENFCRSFSSQLRVSTSCINNWITKAQFWTCGCDKVACWIRAHIVAFIVAENSCWHDCGATVTNCLVLCGQGGTLSKSGNMKEGDRKRGNKKFVNGVLIQKFMGNTPFLCVLPITCHPPFKTVPLLPPLNNPNSCYI